MKKLIFLIIALVPLMAISQPEVPVNKWQGKTIMLIAAHPDDDEGKVIEQFRYYKGIPDGIGR